MSSPSGSKGVDPQDWHSHVSHMEVPLAKRRRTDEKMAELRMLGRRVEELRAQVPQEGMEAGLAQLPCVGEDGEDPSACEGEMVERLPPQTAPRRRRLSVEEKLDMTLDDIVEASSHSPAASPKPNSEDFDDSEDDLQSRKEKESAGEPEERQPHERGEIAGPGWEITGSDFERLDDDCHEPGESGQKASSSAAPQEPDVRHSGVIGVFWHSHMRAWLAHWREDGRTKSKSFSPSKYMLSSGKSFPEANKDALRDAIALRESRHRPRPKVGVSGITWTRGSWRVQYAPEGKKRRSRNFRPRDDTPEEIEKARLAAIEFKRKQEEASSSPAAQPLPVAARPAAKASRQRRRRRRQAKQSGCRGIFWHAVGHAWVVTWGKRGHRRRKWFFVRRRMTADGKSYEEADADTLRDAIAFRESVVRDDAAEEARGSRQAEECGQRGVGERMPATEKGRAANGTAAKEAQPRAGRQRRWQPQEKQSGFVGVCWHSLNEAWAVSWRSGGKRTQKMFFLRTYMDRYCLDYKEADAAAMRDAIAFRTAQNEEAARASEATENGTKRRRLRCDAARQSGVQHVIWHSKNVAWVAAWHEGRRLRQKMFCLKRYISGGKGFAEADGEALRDAIAFRRMKAGETERARTCQKSEEADKEALRDAIASRRKKAGGTQTARTCQESEALCDAVPFQRMKAGETETARECQESEAGETEGARESQAPGRSPPLRTSDLWYLRPHRAERPWPRATG